MGYTIPIGPYHPSLEEPIHAKLYTEGEMIKDAEVFIGYNHRGIEKLATERNFIQTLVLVERVCGICSHSHPFAYSMAVEKIAGMEVPKRGEYIRVIMAELERLHSHYLWMGLACHLIGFDSMFMYIWDAREKVMDILEEISGNRVNYGMVIIGGARRDISNVMRENVIAMLNEMAEPNKRMMEIFMSDKTLAMRTKGVGVLPTADALRIGTVGPHARASGLKMDVRKDAPYSSYEDFEFDIPVLNDCDVWSRVAVRMLEVEESIKIIKQALDRLPEGPINLGVKLPKVPAGEFVARHEAPRGEVMHYVVADGGQNNYRLSIHVPTFKTASTVAFMLKGNTIADAGLIIASIDPCFSCLDR
jgi:Ni,Fe-hydrogenase III large subunit